MRRWLAASAVLWAFLLAAAPLSASPDKVLQNRRGNVAFQRQGGTAVAVAVSSSVSLADGDYALTGPNSLAAVILPDSSAVLLGADTRIQLAFFNQAQIATARFVLYNGKTRFEIRHPQGAMANYAFATSTGQIAVRGTDGDIDFSGGSLRVNVYDLTDPGSPVTVSLANGRTISLRAGETMFAHYVNGVLVVGVDRVTKQAVSTFSDFGPPPPRNGGQPPKTGGGPTGPAAGKQTPAANNGRVWHLEDAILGLIAILLALALLAESFFARPLWKLVVRARFALGRFPMTPYCRARLAVRSNIDPKYIGRVILNPLRTRTQRDGRVRRWGIIKELGMWLRVTTTADDVVLNAFFDRGFNFEDRVRPRN